MEQKIFELFRDQWALVSAGREGHFNGCTVAWGSMGTLWKKSIITVYLHPSRYTCDFLRDNDYFTVSFFPQTQRKALGYMGSHSGRDGDKAAAAGLMPQPMGQSMTYAQASRTYLCRKIYQHPFAKEDLAPEIRDYYAGNPKSFPPDAQGSWQPHWQFIGEVVDVQEGEARR